MTTLTYGELGRSLQGIGFTSRDNVEKQARIYEHPESGAAVYLPLFPDDLTVQPRHLAVVRITLGNFGLPDPFTSGSAPNTAG